MSNPTEQRQRKNTKCYVFIGATGEGKNTFADKLIGESNCFYYDVQNNYPNLPLNNDAPRGRFYGNWKDFVKVVQNKRDSWIVFDEATATLQGVMPEGVKMTVISKQWHGNNWIFLFHTIRSVPPFLMDTADFIILFKTGDELSEVKRRRGKLVKPFLELMKEPKYSKRIIKNI